MISKNELKFIRSLKIKKYRQAEKAFLIEGEKNVLELIQSDFAVRHIVGTEAFINAYPDVANHPKISLASSKVVTSISSLSTNDRVVAVAETKNIQESDIDHNKLILGLDGISDPGNLGTIIRTMDWFGFDQIVCSLDSVDLYNPKVIAATMGSFARIKVVHADLPSFMAGYAGAKVGAEMDGKSVSELALSEKGLMLVMGSESHGISNDVSQQLNYSVTIPRFGGAESLNVGIATGILCHHLASSNS